MAAVQNLLSLCEATTVPEKIVHIQFVCRIETFQGTKVSWLDRLVSLHRKTYSYIKNSLLLHQKICKKNICSSGSNCKIHEHFVLECYVPYSIL